MNIKDKAKAILLKVWSFILENRNMIIAVAAAVIFMSMWMRSCSKVQILNQDYKENKKTIKDLKSEIRKQQEEFFTLKQAIKENEINRPTINDNSTTSLDSLLQRMQSRFETDGAALLNR